MFTFQKKRILRTHFPKNEVSDTNHKNFIKAKTTNHDVRYEIERRRSSDKQRDDTLKSSDSEENKESEYIVQNKALMFFFV